MSNKKKGKNPFAQSQKKKVENREALVRKALTLLSGASFDSLNSLAVSTAQVVTELERRQAKDGEDVSPISRTTLTRKEGKYRHILLAHFEGSAHAEKSDEEAELEELQLHCAHLEHENELLKHRLSTTGGNAPETPSEAQEGRSDKDDIEMLIDIIDGIMDHLFDAFVIVGPNEVSEETPDPGIYAIETLIAEYDDLIRLNELREAVKNER